MRNRPDDLLGEDNAEDLINLGAVVLLGDHNRVLYFLTYF